MIKIKSYSDINGLGFGASEAEAIAHFGNPIDRRKNRERETELHYENFILRFTETAGRMRECTLLPPCSVSINDVHITWGPEFLQWLASEDGSLKEVFGFILSLKLGVAASGFHDDEPQKAIHTFEQGDWDIFSEQMRTYQRMSP